MIRMMLVYCVALSINTITIQSTKFNVEEKVEEVIVDVEQNLIDSCKTLELNKYNVGMAIKKLDSLYHKSIVYKQSIHESGWYRSTLAKKHNNLFGMKFPRVRKTYASSKTKSGYAHYDHWIDSILDYREWQKLRDASTVVNYFIYLKSRKYFEDVSYIKKLNGINIKSFNVVNV